VATAAFSALTLSNLNAPQVVYPNIPTSASAYNAGQCTYGVSQIYPSIYQYMGNGGEWVDSARSQGYQVLPTPQVGTIVCYGGGGGYSQLGHVAVVIEVNSASTYTVLEMNYVGTGVWDERLTDMTDVAGFIVPPGSPSVDNLQSYTSTQQTATVPCVTFSWSVAGSTICFDGAIGAVTVGAGFLLMAVGAIVCVAFAIGHTKAGRAATDTLDSVGLSPVARNQRAKQAQRNATMDNEDMARAMRLEAIRSSNKAREDRRAKASSRLVERRNLSQRSAAVSKREIATRHRTNKEEIPF
jgi:surface antigen